MEQDKLIRVFEIQFNEEEFSQTKDELIDIARELRQRYLSLEDVPVVTDLMNGPVGYIGQRSLVLEQLQLLVAQTALFHSYYDLQFITIFPEEEKEKMGLDALVTSWKCSRYKCTWICIP